MTAAGARVDCARRRADGGGAAGGGAGSAGGGGGQCTGMQEHGRGPGREGVARGPGVRVRCGRERPAVQAHPQRQQGHPAAQHRPQRATHRHLDSRRGQPQDHRPAGVARAREGPIGALSLLRHVLEHVLLVAPLRAASTSRCCPSSSATSTPANTSTGSTAALTSPTRCERTLTGPLPCSPGARTARGLRAGVALRS